MCARERLPAKERKKEIRKAAKQVFLKKGFSDTTMEDVIAEVGMSKGGVYRHYSSTSEMLYDLMLEGNDDRNTVISNFLSEYSDLSARELAVEIMVMKLIDEAEYKPLYVMFLIEAEKNPKLKELKNILEENYKKEFLAFLEEKKLPELKCFFNEEWIAFINSIIVATEILDVREVFFRHKELFASIVNQYMELSQSDKNNS